MDILWWCHNNYTNNIQTDEGTDDDELEFAVKNMCIYK